MIFVSDDLKEDWLEKVNGRNIGPRKELLNEFRKATPKDILICGQCVVSGFNSKLEQDVLHFLLKGSQPIILVLARRMYKVIPEELKGPLAQNRLLIISVSNASRQSKVTATARNKYICEMADQIVFVGVTAQSSLWAFRAEFGNQQKVVTL